MKTKEFIYNKEGTEWIAHYPDFEDMMVSPYGLGSTKSRAFIELEKWKPVDPGLDITKYTEWQIFPYKEDIVIKLRWRYNTLDVVFGHPGRHYQFFDVPAIMAMEFIDADDHYDHFQNYIRGVYRYARLSG